MHRLARSKCQTRTGQQFRAGGTNYEFLGKIGDGAVGIVRKARDLSSGRTYAVKLLAPDPKYIDIKAFDDVAERFRREGRRGRGLKDENLVEIIAYEDNEDGSCFESRSVKNPFIVMEFIRGGTLEWLIRKLAARAPGEVQVTSQTLSIAARVARAIRYLHEKRIIHRDIKPANIFVSSVTVGEIPDSVKLGDFGVTKWGDFLASAASGTLTVTQQQGLGTLKYMSPEQAVRPREVTVRSDIFSFGITLFELFTGQILASPHHVFQIMSARTTRNTVTGKLYSLGIKLTGRDDYLFSMILDMFLIGPTGRPTSERVSGVLESHLERFSEDQEEN